MKNNLIVFIIDDNIPIIKEFVEKSIYNRRIEPKNLKFLVNQTTWKGQQNLQHLTKILIDSKYSTADKIKIYGYTHPELCFNDIESGLDPDIIVFDWEYGTESYKESSSWLKHILIKSKAFIFIYSQVRDEVPPYINKKEFNNYANKFQLFLKGDKESSIYSSEEFIFQYIVMTLSKNNRLLMHDIQFQYDENSYLTSPTDILYLERILGRQFLLDKIKEINFTINDQNLEKLISSVTDSFLINEKSNFLFSKDSEIFAKKFINNKEISYLEVFKKYGVQILMSVLENGFIKL